MSRFITSFASLLFAAVLLTLVSGCQRPVDACSEFDPPPGKEPTACPPKAAAIQAQPATPARYCYSSLAQIECYAEPQPGRPGYLGSTEAPPPSAAAVNVKGDAAPAVPLAPPPAAPAQVSPPPVASRAPATSAPTPLKPAS